MKSGQTFSDQIVAFLVQEGINQKEAEMLSRVAEIQQVAAEKMQYANTALSESLQCVERVRDFVSNPGHILGSMQTKHGEIAEQIEVEIRNGRDILKHLKPTATFDGVGRTAPEDYIINNEMVQSKFINGANKSLDAVMGHLKGYPGFADKGYYHIPKDQYELIMKLASGENVEGIHSRTIAKCQEMIKAIESETGKPFTEVVRPGISTYSEVQLGNVGKTLDGYETEFHETHDAEVKEIQSEKTAQTEQAHHITDASWGEALKYSAVSAIIQGTTSAGIKIFTKIHKGKKIRDFSKSDWKEIGYDFGKGSGKGAISGFGIYGLTKVGGFSAPFAGAMVSTTMGLASLLVDYKKGKITELEYAESANALSVEAGFVAIGSAIGQAVIPIPALGAIVGYAVSKSAFEITKYLVGKDEKKLVERLEKEYLDTVTKLNTECKAIIADIEAYFLRLDGYIEAAMSRESAARLYGSVELCRFLNIPENQVLHNIQEIDDFMLG